MYVCVSESLSLEDAVKSLKKVDFINIMKN